MVGVNLAAGWRLIRTCDPLLRAAEAGRAVFLTDSLAREPRAYWGAYGATKAGLEHLALTWAEETRTTRLRVNLFDPGRWRRGCAPQALPGEDPRNLPLPAHIAPAIAALCCPIEARHGAIVGADAWLRPGIGSMTPRGRVPHRRVSARPSALGRCAGGSAHSIGCAQDPPLAARWTLLRRELAAYGPCALRKRMPSLGTNPSSRIRASKVPFSMVAAG